jgi:ABC-type phosphate transport system substrate-binding protein
MRSPFKAALLVCGAAALATALVQPASADPAQAVAGTDITAVGSDTIQFADDAIATAYNATTPTPTKLYDSWDAVNPKTGAVHDQITIKPGNTITRPDGSSEGITALKTIAGVDVARSSRGPQTGDVDSKGNPLLFLPFAEDELKYATATTTNAPQNLTTAQLVSIYTCVDTTWTQVGGTSTATIHPVIPQSGSGTRSFFLSTLGNITPGTCVSVVQENDPTAEAGNPNALGPFSVAQFTSRFQHSGIQLNPGASNGGYDQFREVYHVVALDPTTGTVNSLLWPLLGNGTGRTTTGYVCSTAGQAVVAGQGFAALDTTHFPNARCGKAEHI